MNRLTTYILLTLSVASACMADGPSKPVAVAKADGPSSVRKSVSDSAQLGQVGHGADEPQTSSPLTNAAVFGDIIRVPYQSHRIYQVPVAPGAPLVVELPQGETAKNVWTDGLWWDNESTPTSAQILIKAKDATGVIGKRTFVHIVMQPSGLRATFATVAVSPAVKTPGVFAIYFDGQDATVAKQREFETSVQDRVNALQVDTDKAYKGQFQDWQAKAIGKMRGAEAFKVSGDFKLDRVSDDGIQTYIFSSLSEAPSVTLINKDKAPEVLNLELSNGVYRINHVLVDGERYELNIGKQKTTIKLK